MVGEPGSYSSLAGNAAASSMARCSERGVPVQLLRSADSPSFGRLELPAPRREFPGAVPHSRRIVARSKSSVSLGATGVSESPHGCLRDIDTIESLHLKSRATHSYESPHLGAWASCSKSPSPGTRHRYCRQPRASRAAKKHGRCCLAD